MVGHKKHQSQISSQLGSKHRRKTTDGKYKNIIVITLCILIPAIIGFLSNDILIGGTLLATGLLSSYLAGIGKRSGYIFGIINDLLIAYVAFKNNLFGSFVNNALVFAPIELVGFIMWGRNLDKNRNVKPKKLTPGKSLLVVSGCIASSIITGYILSSIPGQQLAFMDSFTNCLDLCALILMNLRHKEAWILWVISGILAIIIWTITFFNSGESAFMLLISETAFLIIDAYGAFKWSLKSKNYRSR